LSPTIERKERGRENNGKEMKGRREGERKKEEGGEGGGGGGENVRSKTIRNRRVTF
jgi:hypothetical protein